MSDQDHADGVRKALAESKMLMAARSKGGLARWASMSPADRMRFVLAGVKARKRKRNASPGSDGISEQSAQAP